MGQWTKSASRPSIRIERLVPAHASSRVLAWNKDCVGFERRFARCERYPLNCFVDSPHLLRGRIRREVMTIDDAEVRGAAIELLESILRKQKYTVGPDVLGDLRQDHHLLLPYSCLPML